MTQDSRPQPDAERLITNLETLKVFSDPMRTRIIRALAHEPRTVHEVAKVIGVPFTRLYYHVNMLEKHGIIRVVETRNLSGAVEEKYYQVAARAFVVDRDLLTVRPPGEDASAALQIVLEALVENTRRDIVRSVANDRVDLKTTAPDARALLIRRGISLIPRERAPHFYARLLDLMQEFNATDSNDDEDDEYYAMVVAFYPTAQPYGEEEDSV